MRIIIVVIAALLLVSCYSKVIHEAKPYKNYVGPVVDSSVAVKIAIANWVPIYGKKVFTSRPFKSRILNDTTWVVTGSLKGGVPGGYPVIRINKLNGKILEITHTK